MFKSILVLCTGNICRSPLAEYMLRNTASRLGLSTTVASAGLHVLEGKPAEPHAITVAHQHGLDISPHRARQLTEQHFKSCDLILVMESWQQKELELRYPFIRGRTHLLGKWNQIEIEDPYLKTIEAFKRSYADIEVCINLWCERIWSK